MTAKLDNDSIKALVKYRIERAEQTLGEIGILVEHELFSTAVNRLYYAVYYAAIALLIKDGHQALTHSGVRSMLGMNYIRTGILDKEVGNNFMLLFEKRHRNDYDDFIESSKEEVMGLLPLATEFVNKVKDLLAIEL